MRLFQKIENGTFSKTQNDTFLTLKLELDLKFKNLLIKLQYISYFYGLSICHVQHTGEYYFVILYMFYNHALKIIRI